MKESNIIQNLGLEKIPKYGFGSWIRSIWDKWFSVEKAMEEIEQKKKDTENVSSKKSKTASTGKKSSTESTKVVTTSTPQGSTPSNTPTGNMDWMSEYGSPQTNTETTSQQEVEEREPFNAVEKVWNDEVLSKVDTAVASRYLKNNLQDLLNMYNMKVAETIGQKRS